MSAGDDGRRQEINMFAAMANGDFDAVSASDPISEGGAAVVEADSSRNLFSAAAMAADPSGTFNFQESLSSGTESQSYGAFAKNHNLEAAAAALGKDENPAAKNAADNPQATFFSQKDAAVFSPEKFPKLAPRTPMHSQLVHLQKPLFFGHKLPPRVIDEAKEIVDKCPKDRPFPPEVQNLISAIRTYGHGYDLLKEDSESTPYATVFCPKWSERLPAPSDPLAKGDVHETSPHNDIGFGSPAAVSEIQTAAGQPSGEQHTGSSSTNSISVQTSMNEQDLFSMWARGEDVATSSPNGSPVASPTLERPYLGRDTSEGSLSSIAQQNSDEVMSDRHLFSQWARGESPREDGNAANSMLGASSSSIGFAANVDTSVARRRSSSDSRTDKLSGTFLNLPAYEEEDDDEVVVSELKKKVGVNEHLNAALAYLEEEKDDPRNASAAIEDSTNKMSHIPLTADGGRPLTNHELMNGVAPLFGCDDASLPTEADLGTYSTGDEQQRYREQRRDQAIIENCCPQNIFGPLACPTPALNPEDNHSWASRTSPPIKATKGLDSHPGIPRTVAHSADASFVGAGGAPKLGGNMSSASSVASKVPHLLEKRLDPRLRYGWWNNPRNDDVTSGSSNHEAKSSEGDLNALSQKIKVGAAEEETPSLVLPPELHPAGNVLVQTGLEPTAEKLQEHNRPLSHLHPATTIAQSLPFLSDRPPSYRYLQVDTQAVGFLGLGGEVEPLFCSLAIYHVETIAPNASKDSSLSPIPNLQRCGKVTETLHFDVVSDETIEQRCHGALWPFGSRAEDEMSRGTRCGVFPLPSNLNISNLYAILIVHKVVSEGSDLDPYLLPTGTVSENSDGTTADLESLRRRAEKACSQQGKFLMPFSFCVAPLVQVFGADIPVVPSSRLVEIPLFKFSAEKGERQIIDHIMVMLYPRADHAASGIGGPAPVTNKGKAMLVMRNFGYLGLHSVIDSKSVLARDRLVDFTREIQIRRKTENDMDEKATGIVNIETVTLWQSSFIAEPTKAGGRIKSENLQMNETNGENSGSQSPLYAQELAPLRLHASPLRRFNTSPVPKSHRGRGYHASGDDIEPYFQTSFCNEMLCYPRHLQNCPRGNIVIKTELREVEWVPAYEVYVAHLPSGGPALHNSRRGPAFVQSLYSSCSTKVSDASFLDEFKFRLPLVLQNNPSQPTDSVQRQAVIFFTIFRLSFSSRKKWGKRFRNKKSGRKMDEITGELVGESDWDSSSSNFHMMQISCGYLPLSKNSAILPDGNHDVKMTGLAYSPRKEAIQKGVLNASSIVLADLPSADDLIKQEPNDIAEDSESIGSGKYPGETASATSGSESLTISEVSENSRRGKSRIDPICLQVRVAVHSSVHAQNATLNEFLGQDSSLTLPSTPSAEFSNFLKLDRDRLVEQCSVIPSSPLFESNHEAERLQISSVDIAKTSMCPTAGVSEHLIRVVTHLWRNIVFGCGEASPQWANPGAFLPLRIQSFATLLQVLGSTSVYFSKRGLKQLDGANKWNLTTLSRNLAVVFDEYALFGEGAQEFFISKSLSTLTKELDSGASTAMKRRQHVRSTFEFLSETTSDGGDTVDTRISENVSSRKNRFFGGLTSMGTTFERDDTPESSDRHINRTSAVLTSDDEDVIKVDSVTDFRSALKAGFDEMDDDAPIFDGSQSGSEAAMSLVKAFSGPQAMSRRFMTAPVPGLATIREDADDGLEEGANAFLGSAPAKQVLKGPLDSSLETDLFVKPTRSAVKQMRVPKISKTPKDEGGGIGVKSPGAEESTKLSAGNFDSNKRPSVTDGNTTGNNPSTRGPRRHAQYSSNTLPSTEAELQKAGSSFLDSVELTRGKSGKISSAGEEDQVGKAHHRKTRSRCSIDWSIPNDNMGRIAPEATPPDAPDVVPEPKEFDQSMTTLSSEQSISINLPSYIDRLQALKEAPSIQNLRWFPFTYEVIIMQWAGILTEQRKGESEVSGTAAQGMLTDLEDPLPDAASRAAGVAIACAPVLLEIIKQSIGWRIHNFKKAHQSKQLLTLDDSLMSSLEKIVESISLACIDFRNFDAWETRQTCIDVNDSLVWFLRDMFGFLDPCCVHRLVMIYLTNLLATGAKLQDRDSSTGLRCSWEVTKLQLNAITAFVRFPDLIKINSPQFNSLDDSLFGVPGFSTAFLFDELLRSNEMQRSGLTDGRVMGSLSGSNKMRMQPHWLVDIITDVCLLGTEHAEQNIQRRSSSLLFEMFWTQSQQSTMEGNRAIIASIYMPFLEKILQRTTYISKCFGAKNQVRQDILRCVVFILQSAPGGLLQALWRKLLAKTNDNGVSDKFGWMGPGTSGDFDSGTDSQHGQYHPPKNDSVQSANIFDMFSLINLGLSSFEFEGSDEDLFGDDATDEDNTWRKEYLLAIESDTPAKAKQRRLLAVFGKSEDAGIQAKYSSSCSRRWHSHDGSLVLVKTAQQIVREFRNVLEPSEEGRSFFNPARQKLQPRHRQQQSAGTQSSTASSAIRFTYVDTVMFVRAATSVYLHALSLEQSDITLLKSLSASLEVVKIFGIKLFNEAIGETLQHWMRVITFHCGSRRAEVRIQASDFLELVLRSTWDSFGSFFRIRLPLLAVQTEVMEKIVATAANRHYREQQSIGIGSELFTTGSAEASLAPLWRTLDRLHHQSASQNVAFRSALVRLAEKVKKLFRAYVAAHALAFLQKASKPDDTDSGHVEKLDVEQAKRTMEIQTFKKASINSIQRVINASAGYSKQFLGLHSTEVVRSAVAHNEAVEDAFLAAADVFSPTELPDHRVAWLRRLANFHSVRRKYAEEATCHYNIHITLQQASSLHGTLWFSTPFLPWTNSNLDEIYGGEGPLMEDDHDDDPYDNNFGRHMDNKTSFRRIFYRNENSLRIAGGDIDAGASGFAFCGVTLPSEYNMISPWTSMREMEASMLEEAEAAGDLFLKSGIVASSRYAWSLAVRHYAEKFSYGKLKHVYENLAHTVVSQVPPLDLNQQEVSVTVPLGRFYRVWFHGGAPDELIGAEFVYRTASNVKLEQFGKDLKDVIRCIIPDNTPIHLVLDGRAEERESHEHSSGFRMGSSFEPVRVKVTPLRAMVTKSSRMRGLPEWFHDYIDSAFAGLSTSVNTYGGRNLKRHDADGGSNDSINRPRHRDHNSSSSASVFSSLGSSMAVSRRIGQATTEIGRRFRHENFEGELAGADKFSFMQPISKGRDRGAKDSKGRDRGAKDWLRGYSGDFAAKTLRVTQLQVGQAFPACVSRQAVVHRVVFTQSPLEAASDSICQWCAILFRTAIATNGQAVLGTNRDPGIGIDAAKVVSDCIHSSRVKEMGLYLLKKNTNFEEEEEGDALQSYDRLSEDEVKRLQIRLARSLVVFMELLHLMITRNRELLLEVIKEKKKCDSSSRHSHSTSVVSLSDVRSMKSTITRQSSANGNDSRADSFSEKDRPFHRRKGSGFSFVNDDSSVASVYTSDKARTDSAIGIQSELQRAFISLCKEVQPRIVVVMGSQTPRWLKLCMQDNYFSAYTYRNVKIAMEEELAFDSLDDTQGDDITKHPVGAGPRSTSSQDGVSYHGRSVSGMRAPESPGGSLGSGSFASRSSDAGRSQQSSKRSVKSSDFMDRRLALTPDRSSSRKTAL